MSPLNTTISFSGQNFCLCLMDKYLLMAPNRRGRPMCVPAFQETAEVTISKNRLAAAWLPVSTMHGACPQYYPPNFTFGVMGERAWCRCFFFHDFRNQGPAGIRKPTHGGELLRTAHAPRASLNVLPTTRLAAAITCACHDVATAVWHTPGEVHSRQIIGPCVHTKYCTKCATGLITC